MTLKKGDTVIIVSPAGRVLDENVDNAVATLESWGLDVLVSANAKKEHFNFSGTLEDRLADLQWALDHPTAKAIFASRGGYGAIQLLDKLDWSTFTTYPKLLVGYSDICNLHSQINKLGAESLHALMPNSFPKLGESNASLETLKNALFHRHYSIEWENNFSQVDFELDGEIVGGNLSILYSLLGTPYAPNYQDKILFIEDLSEYIYHIDRMLHSFELSGVFSQIKALIVGDFTEMKDNDTPFGKSVNQVIQDIVTKYQVPVVFGLRTGHGSPTLALPFKREGKLTSEGNKCLLKF